ncbi:hypothetical protein RIF25_10830 [Thermosynechococcaceae cyanobacterium BACA0444]|uniref:Uncharacterized protein n=1 Tax=Pseudocalidococcus azoricus BACA0444 TaxID=2918990 RepID=A0AAE4FSH3_9CYAN|nr:hypothetical protein [Pseudocalidococcus azoricus]MDS3861301.1 hypothetical protein [Pseudocalidococcus azoricus BACA0444]
MANVVNWQQQSVDQFLEQVNWLGLSVAIPTPVDSQAWLGLSVQDFWQGCNWEGQRQVRQVAWGIPAVSERRGERLWLNCSVTEFIQAANWTGQPLSISKSLAEVIPPPVRQPVPSTWLQLSVMEFFERVNWLGKPEQAQLLPGMQSPLQLSVAQFCQAVAWDLKPVIGAVPPLTLPPEPEPDPTMTLTDLSSLF